MIKVCIIIREPGRTKPDYSLDFNLPTLPRKGDYISVQRPDKPSPWGEDMIVREIWWRLNHPETGGSSSSQPKVGAVHEIMIECEPATSPYSSDNWKKYVEGYSSPKDVPTFDVARLDVREGDLK
jgi:hypothetical protein